MKTRRKIQIQNQYQFSQNKKKKGTKTKSKNKTAQNSNLSNMVKKQNNVKNSKRDETQIQEKYVIKQVKSQDENRSENVDLKQKKQTNKVKIKLTKQNYKQTKIQYKKKDEQRHSQEQIQQTKTNKRINKHLNTTQTNHQQNQSILILNSIEIKNKNKKQTKTKSKSKSINKSKSRNKSKSKNKNKNRQQFNSQDSKKHVKQQQQQGKLLNLTNEQNEQDWFDQQVQVLRNFNNLSGTMKQLSSLSNQQYIQKLRDYYSMQKLQPSQIPYYTSLYSYSHQISQINKLKDEIAHKLDKGKIMPLILPYKARLTKRQAQQLKKFHVQNAINTSPINIYLNQRVKKTCYQKQQDQNSEKSFQEKSSNSQSHYSSDQPLDQQSLFIQQNFKQYYFQGTKFAFDTLNKQKLSQKQVKSDYQYTKRNYLKLDCNARYFYKNLDQEKLIFCDQAMVDKMYAQELLVNYAQIFPQLEEMYQNNWNLKFNQGWKQYDGKGNARNFQKQVQHWAINQQQFNKLKDILLGKFIKKNQSQKYINKSIKLDVVKTNDCISNQDKVLQNKDLHSLKLVQNRQSEEVFEDEQEQTQKQNKNSHVNSSRKQSQMSQSQQQIDWGKKIQKSYKKQKVTGISTKNKHQTQQKSKIKDHNYLKYQNQKSLHHLIINDDQSRQTQLELNFSTIINNNFQLQSSESKSHQQHQI